MKKTIQFFLLSACNIFFMTDKLNIEDLITLKKLGYNLEVMSTYWDEAHMIVLL